jgi:hypothetical protein
MQVKLAHEHELLHKTAIDLCRRYRELEWPIVEILQKIDRLKVYRHLGAASLFQYAMRFLGLSEAMAYSFITVARKSAELPELGEVIKNQTLSVAKASRITAVLKPENAPELIEFAARHSKRELEFKVAELNPKLGRKPSVCALSGDSVELTVHISKGAYEALLRTQAILAQKNKNLDLGEAIDSIVQEFVHRHDPVLKAKRARALDQNKTLRTAANSIKESYQLCPGRVAKGVSARKPFTAEQKHKVFARDQGRCTHVDAHGHRCDNDRWLHVHHIEPVSKGGGNNPENLTTLCSAHHDLAHQMSFPIEGQVTWLRAPRAVYAL